MDQCGSLNSKSLYYIYFIPHCAMNWLVEKYEQAAQKLCKEYDISYDDLDVKFLHVIKAKFWWTLFELLWTEFEELKNKDTFFWGTLAQLNEWFVKDDYWSELRRKWAEYLDKEQNTLALQMAMYSKAISTVFECCRSIRTEWEINDIAVISHFMHFVWEEKLLWLTWESYKALEHIDKKESLVIAYNDVIRTINKSLHVHKSEIKTLYHYLCDYGSDEWLRQYDMFCLREKISQDKSKKDLKNKKKKPDFSIDYFIPIQENWSEFKQLPVVQKELQDAEHYMQKIRSFKESKGYTDSEALDLFCDEIPAKKMRTKLLFLQTQVQCEWAGTISEEEVMQARKDELFFLVMHHHEFFQNKMHGKKLTKTRWKDEHFSLNYYREYLWRYGELPEHGITQERLQEYENKFKYCVDGKDNKWNMFSDSYYMYKKSIANTL